MYCSFSLLYIMQKGSFQEIEKLSYTILKKPLRHVVFFIFLLKCISIKDRFLRLFLYQFFLFFYYLLLLFFSFHWFTWRDHFSSPSLQSWFSRTLLHYRLTSCRWSSSTMTRWVHQDCNNINNKPHQEKNNFL